MSKIRVLSDQLINQIAAGEVVERPASVVKELVENAIDAGARRIGVDVEGGGRRLLRVADDGEGMTTDDALLAFERHATSKITSSDDLFAISTLGFRGEALASIASVARVELLTKREDAQAATRVMIEGGRIRDVKDAAHPKGTTFSVRDLFFNVPARRKFLRSEATESFHLTNLVTHYALAHPEIAFTLTNNGRETLRAAPARDLRERAFQIFGERFIANLLEVSGGLEGVARVHGFVSAPRERRTSRDAQYLFINGRYVRDTLISRALSDGYRTILPQGVYPAALLFLEVPLEEVDVNVHPAKTEVRFRRAAAVADAVREAVRRSLASAGYSRASEQAEEEAAASGPSVAAKLEESPRVEARATDDRGEEAVSSSYKTEEQDSPRPAAAVSPLKLVSPVVQNRIEFETSERVIERGAAEVREESVEQATVTRPVSTEAAAKSTPFDNPKTQAASVESKLPHLSSLSGIVRELPAESVGTNIRPLGQLEASFIIATDDEGLLLIDQHKAHERILFDQYSARERRTAESQNLLMPETFDLTPAQATAFEAVSEDLETYGFGLMRLSGRTVAVRAVPADLASGEARSLLAELLDSIEADKRTLTRAALTERISLALAQSAAIKYNSVLAPEKMRWLVDRLLLTSSPTTCPHGRPIVLRLATRDIEKSFRRT
ncbi:MAG TPA: DNA mismatch repair endonuclease MutL [Pyrinomonadaceae bacterium]|nr:DNA mismatch repair endonuclease MutL [Pyrinomonadaceae bacterium]